MSQPEDLKAWFRNKRYKTNKAIRRTLYPGAERIDAAKIFEELAFPSDRSDQMEGSEYEEDEA
jgi:hypothetical protein